ncbi:MAG: PQQ-dependent sugar dehydrogenase [Anaerolineales bacterium]|nr:PQQ-dependent sugar dehydrogenase [Anaerolineales bacterium]
MNKKIHFRFFLLTGIVLILTVVACTREVGEPTESPASPTENRAPTVALTEQVNLPVIINAPSETPAPLETPIVLTPAATDTPNLPPSPTPTPLVFAVIGDYGYDSSDEDNVAEVVISWDPAFIITLGDNNYPSGSADTIDANIGQYYHAYIGAYQGDYGSGSEANRFFPVPGNHDWDTSGLQPYLDYFTLPGNERYYDFTWGPVHFFALDSDSREPDGVGFSSVQGKWFQQTINASTSPWNIVYMHHAPYSSGGYHGSTDWARWPYATWGVDAVLAGHEHVYERLLVDGIPYFNNGLGGNPNQYWFSSPLPESQFRYQEKHGALRVSATEATMTFEFFNVNWEVIDTYTLTNPDFITPPVESAPTPENFPDPSVVTFPDPGTAAWQTIGTNYISPVLVTNAGDGSNRLFVVEQPGTIQIIGQNTPFLDIRERVGDDGNEQGLLGLAFHPDYAQNGFFFVDYTDNKGDTVIARYQVSTDDSNHADPNSETILLQIRQPYPNHNGGHLAFGPDGYLYIATGDGGSGGDPEGNAQNSFTLLGKLLRIDVNTKPYLSPADNPFAQTGDGLKEIWAYGLRNPWRFSFDRLTGDLYIGDVGQNEWEEIDFVAAGTPGGLNFGWDVLEGTHPYEGSAPSGLALTAPIWDYSHATGTCSVTGGVVYRGVALPAWNGVYLFGDFCSGQIWGLLRDANGVWQETLLFQTGLNITSFGQDEAGEVYLVARQGEVYKLIGQ